MPDRTPPAAAPAAPVRAFWSGTLTFGLVSIPVDFYAAAAPRRKSLRMVDAEGHALGRQYVSAKAGKPLANEQIVRGFETEDGQVILITDEELEAAAPETSRDIELARFVPLAQIPPQYFVRPYFLAPAGRSGKAYTLLAQTMERAGQAGFGRMVMRGHEYLLALLAEGGILRAETLRFADELRTPAEIGLPAAPKSVPRPLLRAMDDAIGHLAQDRLDLHELEDRDAEALQALARRKAQAGQDVIALQTGEAEPEDEEGGGAELIDLMQVLKRSLGTPASTGGGRAAGPASRSANRSDGAGTHRTAAGRKAQAAAAPAPAPDEDLLDKSRDELYQLAARLQVPGRSHMTKGELAEAVRMARH